MTLNSWGFCGCCLIIIGHGLCSSGLFCLSNIIYERLGSHYKSLLFMRFVIYISSLVIYCRDRYMMGDHNLSRFVILNVKSYNAGIITALSNRIGDVALLLLLIA
ncbi:NADH-ubiquinone oxidoreductase chain 5 [Gryllus bimaculatus]|nr:NADH-ubiquinone oxidoreductase chain 5 [Gryllus bimaculatus]